MATRTAILVKDEMIGLIGMRSEQTGCAMLIRVDPREDVPGLAHQDCQQIAERNYRWSLRHSIQQGWRVIHDGPPNFG